MNKINQSVAVYKRDLGRDLRPVEHMAILTVFLEPQTAPDYTRATEVIENMEFEIEDRAMPAGLQPQT